MNCIVTTPADAAATASSTRTKLRNSFFIRLFSSKCAMAGNPAGEAGIGVSFPLSHTLLTVSIRVVRWTTSSVRTSTGYAV